MNFLKTSLVGFTIINTSYAAGQWGGTVICNNADPDTAEPVTVRACCSSLGLPPPVPGTLNQLNNNVKEEPSSDTTKLKMRKR